METGSFARARTRERTTILIRIMVCGVLAAGLLVTSAPDASAVDNASISGVVTDSSGPLSGVHVDVYTADADGYVDGTVTDSDGKYAISGLAAGTYQVSFNDWGADSHVNEWYDDHILVDDSDDVVLGAGEVRKDINAELADGATISGMVTGHLGEPIDGYVTASFDERFVAIAYTEPDGSYTIDGLPPETYFVEFTDSDGVHIGEWFEDASDQDSAAKVGVPAGGDVTGIDASLALGSTISGTVTDGVDPLENIWIDVWNPALGTYVAYGETAADGTYTITGLRPDTYKVRFTDYDTGHIAEWYDDQRWEWDATAIAVSGDVTGIDAELLLGASISGTVTDGSAAPIDDVIVQVFSPTGVVGSGRTEANGTYLIEALPPGLVTVEFYDYTDTFVSEWYDDQRSQDDADELLVSSGVETSGIDATLSIGSTISGTVTSDDGGAPLGGQTVYVSEDGGPFWGSTETEPDGTYTLNGLYSGNFKVRFVGDDGYAGEWYDDQQDEAAADLIAVGDEAAVLGIDAQLTLGGSIAGQVTSPGGSPLADIAVNIYDDAYGWVMTVDTGVDGRYDADGLAPGDYVVEFVDPAVQFVSEYHENATYGNADLVAVASGLETTVDAQLAYDLPDGSVYVPLVPCRVLDTRSGGGGRLGPNVERDYQVAGTGPGFAAQGGNAGGCGVPTSAVAVEASVSAVAPTGSGYTRAWPSDEAAPNATFMNYSRGQGITNTGAISLSPAATEGLSLRNFGGSSDYVIDVQGFFIDPADLGSLSGAALYVPLVPCRVLDTRSGGGGQFVGNETRDFQVAGSGAGFASQGGKSGGCEVPENALAVEASVSAVTPTGTGYTRAFPSAEAAPNATFMNYSGGQGITNTGAISLSPSEVNGLSIRNFAGRTHYVIDVQGYFIESGEIPDDVVGAAYVPLVPCRVVDTRSGGGGRFLSGSTRSYEVAGTGSGFTSQGGKAGGCSIPATAAAVEASISAVTPAGVGYTRAWPSAETAPNATFMNYVNGNGITNTGAISLSAAAIAGMRVKNFSGTTHHVIDVQGYFNTGT